METNKEKTNREDYIDMIKELDNYEIYKPIVEKIRYHVIDLEVENLELKKLNAKYYDDLRELVLKVKDVDFCSCIANGCDAECNSKKKLDVLMNRYKDAM